MDACSLNTAGSIAKIRMRDKRQAHLHQQGKVQQQQIPGQQMSTLAHRPSNTQHTSGVKGDWANLLELENGCVAVAFVSSFFETLGCCIAALVGDGFGFMRFLAIFASGYQSSVRDCCEVGADVEAVSQDHHQQALYCSSNKKNSLQLIKQGNRHQLPSSTAPGFCTIPAPNPETGIKSNHVSTSSSQSFSRHTKKPSEPIQPSLIHLQ
ncbi:hypothetical protein Nepgr_005274 [Nepenthes gracilis]|uniref:Uncharacterized protein n=1 Tax=Nepenthes gracilis TaxID=150966 RepID=A0AAD3XG78_NEPGR|nr:hypothetical protein Nepgr_005274 [Nepenthes gracilis]